MAREYNALQHNGLNLKGMRMSKRTDFALRGLTGIGILILVAAGLTVTMRQGVNAEEAADPGRATGPGPQETPRMNSTTTKGALPPIDLAAPKKIETATFALG
jgi:hypothetical protein